ncbi:MAG TPA: hypothetical protein VF121_13315 [Thermoanaerobaculia bacterium]|nr:hypothetical protein [Thermoanaerobaculia bacterium]
MTRAEPPLPVEVAAPGPLSREEVRGLLEPRSGPCVSIFLPTVRAGAETQQNPIRWKNLLRAAEERLAARGVRKAESEELLAPLRALQEDHDFWQHQSEGLAVFRAPDLLRAYRLPLPFDELAAVEDRFHLKPLFPYFDGDGRFYVLALAMHDIRLFLGSRWSLEEVELVGVPRSMEEAVGEEVGQKPLQYSQTGPGARVNHGAPGYYTHGASEDDTKTALFQFFKRVEAGLQKQIDRKTPLVLAGVDYLLPIYREASQHPHLLAEAVLGNPEVLRPEELHAAAWKLVEPRFLERRRRAAERYRELTGTGLATGQLELVVGAAHDGRVETLFAPLGVRRWGSWDPAERTVRLDGGADGAEPPAGTEDLLDLAAIQALLHGGEVFAVPPEEVPEKDAPLAAIFRW